jgi:putative flippase GtrA
MRLAPLISPQLLRFAVVIVGGLAVDLGMGWSLANLAGVPLVYAAGIGFFTGALFNYVLHEYWTFRASDSRLSLGRALLYLAMMCVTLGARLSVVFLLAPLATGRIGSLAVLIGAAGVSFVVNYLLSRFVVYRRPTGTPPEMQRTSAELALVPEKQGNGR